MVNPVPNENEPEIVIPLFIVKVFAYCERSIDFAAEKTFTVNGPDVEVDTTSSTDVGTAPSCQEAVEL